MGGRAPGRYRGHQQNQGQDTRDTERQVESEREAGRAPTAAGASLAGEGEDRALGGPQEAGPQEQAPTRPHRYKAPIQQRLWHQGGHTRGERGNDPGLGSKASGDTHLPSDQPVGPCKGQRTQEGCWGQLRPGRNWSTPRHSPAEGARQCWLLSLFPGCTPSHLCCAGSDGVWGVFREVAPGSGETPRSAQSLTTWDASSGLPRGLLCPVWAGLSGGPAHGPAVWAAGLAQPAPSGCGPRVSRLWQEAAGTIQKARVCFGCDTGRVCDPVSAHTQPVPQPHWRARPNAALENKEGDRSRGLTKLSCGPSCRACVHCTRTLSGPASSTGQQVPAKEAQEAIT